MKNDQSTDTSMTHIHAISPTANLPGTPQESEVSAKKKAIEAFAHRLGRFMAERLLNDLKASSSPNTPV